MSRRVINTLLAATAAVLVLAPVPAAFAEECLVIFKEEENEPQLVCIQPGTIGAPPPQQFVQLLDVPPIGTGAIIIDGNRG